MDVELGSMTKPAVIIGMTPEEAEKLRDELASLTKGKSQFPMAKRLRDQIGPALIKAEPPAQ